MKHSRAQILLATAVLALLAQGTGIAQTTGPSGIVLTMDVDRKAVYEGGAVVFTVRLTNAGTAEAADVTVSLSLPDALEILSETVDGAGAFDRDAGLWRVSQLPPTGPGDTATLTLEGYVRESVIPQGEDYHTLRAEASVVGSTEEAGRAEAPVDVLCAGCVDLELQLLSRHTEGDEECGMGCMTSWITSLRFRVTNNGPLGTDEASIRLRVNISGDFDDPVAWLDGEEVEVFGAGLVRPLGPLGSGESVDLALDVLYFTGNDDKARVRWHASVETAQLRDPVANDTLGGSESHASPSAGCFLDALGCGTRTFQLR